MKRAIDIIISAFALIVLLPLVIIICCMVKIKLGSPIFFRQKRPGINGKIFEMFKFRSMLVAVDDKGDLLSDDKRLRAFGEKLRSTSLDELPSLWNVLKGDMSLVGPRPLLVEYLPLYNEEQKRRHDVRPGITGWAQVNGRNALTWEEKFELDVWYVENQSFWLDLKILFMTIKKVFMHDDITHKGDVTMPKFTGSDNA